MSMWDTFKHWLGFGGTIAESITIDADDYLYRPLTGRSISDLPEHQHDKMLKVAMHLDRSNPIANRIMDLLTDFVFAEGVQIKTRNKDVHALLEAHWNDPVNKWDSRGPRMFRIRMRDGEVVMPAGVNPVDGKVRWGMIPSRVVKEVEPDPTNWEIIRTVVLKPETAATEGRRMAVISESPESGRLEGECLFLKLNDDGLRGVSLLYPLADFLDALNTMAFSEVERAQLLRAFVWDVTVSGATEDDLQRFSRDASFQVPKPGMVRLHNEGVVWQALTPALEAWDSTNLLGWILNTLVLGSSGIPEHWFGSGGDVNRAVGTVMDTPTIKMLSRLQRDWRDVMTDVLRFVVDQAVEHGALPQMVPLEDSDGNATDGMVEARLAFEVEVPDMDTTDMAQLATTVVQTVQALVVAEDREYISRETARSVFISAIAQIGPDIDPDDEAKRVQEQTKEREQDEQRQRDRLATEMERVMANGKLEKERVA